MSYSIRFDRQLPGRPPEYVYQALRGWLAQQNAKIEQDSPPFRVTAVHGRGMQMFGWRKDAKKTLTFSIQSMPGGTYVVVDAAPPFLNASDVRTREEEARANWGELLGEAWAACGDAAAAEEAKYATTELRKAGGESGRSMMIGGAIVLPLGVLLLWASIAMAIPFLWWIGFGLPIMGAIALINGGMKVRAAKSVAGQ